jgi:5-methylcytosine-specific restriction protein A
MRRSKRTNTLVLVSKHVNNLYDDRWINDEFHYTGMGQEGDQSLNYMQNKTLNESSNNGIKIHLFEVFEERQYTYIGEVVLAEKPYQEKQPDAKKVIRNVWVFPIKVIGQHQQLSIKDTAFKNLDASKEKEVKKLSDEELQYKAQSVRKKSGVRNVLSIQYERNPLISEYAKRRANGICQLCNMPAPFLNSKKEPYLETHHILWLAKGGNDSIENTVALCPNCHRKMHILNSDVDIEILKRRNE